MARRTEIDMSSEAIAGRLKEIGELWDLWNRLRKAEYLGPVESERTGREKRLTIVEKEEIAPGDAVEG